MASAAVSAAAFRFGGRSFSLIVQFLSVVYLVDRCADRTLVAFETDSEDLEIVIERCELFLQRDRFFVERALIERFSFIALDAYKVVAVRLCAVVEAVSCGCIIKSFSP